MKISIMISAEWWIHGVEKTRISEVELLDHWFFTTPVISGTEMQLGVVGGVCDGQLAEECSN